MNPKYIIFDTNCFLLSIKRKNQTLNFEEIKKYANSNNAYIVISPFTLYEIVQGLHELKHIEEFRKQLIEFGDFWVFNKNGILEHNGLEYGFDFLFSLSLHSNDLLIDFAEKRKKLRAKVYDYLFRKMFFYAGVVSSIYLVLKECNKDGQLYPDTYFKVDYINNHFWERFEKRYHLLFSEAFKHAGDPSYDPISKEFYTDFNAKDRLFEYLHSLIIEILSIADVELTLFKKEWEYEANEYNRRIVEKVTSLSKKMDKKSYIRVYKDCMKRTNKKITPSKVFEELLSNFPESLEKDCFRTMITKLFKSYGVGKAFGNDFIDFSNLIILEQFPADSTVYLTLDRKWVDFLRTSNSPFVKETNSFYDRFRLV